MTFPATLALLHTSPAHIPVFDALRDSDHPGLRLRHLVNEDLLERAGRHGVDAVTDDVRAALDRAVATGAHAVLCTCSTIGGAAEALGARAAVPVLRVDRPMAAAAVAAGPRVTVLATVAATLRPTVDLIEEEAARAARPVSVRTRLADGAWRHFASGDTEAYARHVAAAADELTGTKTDVIVLAQASMAPAQRLAATTVPVLSSPRPGLAAAALAAVSGH